MYIERKLEGIIKKYLPSPEIIAVVGPRQSGKTTLLNHIQAGLPDSVFLTFEDLQLRETFDLDLKTFIELYIKPFRTIFIDEFQYARTGGQSLKFVFDTVPDRKILISGSSSLDLTVKAVKFLAGRLLAFTLYPFSFREFLSARDEPISRLLEGPLGREAMAPPVLSRFRSRLEEFVVYGGYPRVVTAESETERGVVLKSLFQISLLRDIKDILGLVDDYKMTTLLKGLAMQAGNLISFDELANLTGQSALTVKKQLNFLEKTFIVSFLRPFYSNKRTELVKNPKVYFFDPGLRNAVIQDYRSLAARGDKADLYETFVFSELMKRDAASKFWRTKSKAEVDFIVGDRIPIEVKSGLSKPLIGKSLHSFISKYKPPRAFVLSESLFTDVAIGTTVVGFRYLFSELPID